MSDSSAKLSEIMNSTKSLRTEYIARSRRAIWHPCTQMKHHDRFPLLPIAKGVGAWLYDVEGQRYLDAISSWWVNLFGHAHPTINTAITSQLELIAHTMLAGCTHVPAIELGERLSSLTNGVLGHAFFASDGASAVEIALKMSAHYWRNVGQSQKNEFVCLEKGYHGETLGALGVTDVACFRQAYGTLLRPAHVVPSPDARLALEGESAIEPARRSLCAIEALFAARSGHIAAMIIEPLVQCAGGMAMYDPIFITELRELCDHYNIHLIADEIAVGCGRTGSFFAYEQAGIQPDFICLSKGISGGYLPLSLVLTRDTIYEAFYDNDIARGFLHSHSYTGNPLACRAALATLDLLEDLNITAQTRLMSDRLAEALKSLAEHPHVRHWRRCGTIIAFDIASDDLKYETSFARCFFETACRHELLLRPIGHTVYVMPPYILSEAEIEHLAVGMNTVLEQVIDRGKIH